MVWRHHPWRQDTADVATVAFDMAVLDAKILGANNDGAKILGAKSPHFSCPLFLPESFSFSYSFSLGFLFGHFGQPLQSTY
jgi:hypothetical protein